MNLIALMPIRNEDWILGLSLRAALRWCHHAVVLNHASTDMTPDILSDIQHETRRLTIINEPDPTWAEMGHRQRMLEAARTLKATHCAIVDADEILTGNLLESVPEQIASLPAGAMLQIPMRNMYGGTHQYRKDNSIWGNTITTMAFADAPGMCWQAQNGYQHHHREPFNSRVGVRVWPQQLDGGIMHLQFAYRRRLLAKHSLYKVDEVVRWPGRRANKEIDREYSMAPDWSGASLEPAPAQWWEPYADLMHHLDLTHEPWQEEAVRRIVAEHGIEKFTGLNLYGVV